MLQVGRTRSSPQERHRFLTGNPLSTSLGFLWLRTQSKLLNMCLCTSVCITRVRISLTYPSAHVSDLCSPCVLCYLSGSCQELVHAVLLLQDPSIFLTFSVSFYISCFCSSFCLFFFTISLFFHSHLTLLYSFFLINSTFPLILRDDKWYQLHVTY